MHRRIIALYGWDHWTSVIGIRADEPRRVAKLAIPNRDRDRDRIAPMAQGGVTAEMVGDFWRRQPFDLALPNQGGRTMHGNCDLCFLKGLYQIVSLVREEPHRADWWARMEALALASRPDGAVFRKDRPSYRQIQIFAERQVEMFEDEALLDCACTD